MSLRWVSWGWGGSSRIRRKSRDAGKVVLDHTWEKGASQTPEPEGHSRAFLGRAERALDWSTKGGGVLDCVPEHVLDHLGISGAVSIGREVLGAAIDNISAASAWART